MQRRKETGEEGGGGYGELHAPKLAQQADLIWEKHKKLKLNADLYRKTRRIESPVRKLTGIWETVGLSPHLVRQAQFSVKL